MNNVFMNTMPDESYDLKGSTVNRSTMSPDEARGHPGTVMKDMDLDKQLQLHRQLRLVLFMQLKADTDWLQSKDIMDYSLLVGIRYEKGFDKTTEVKYLDKSNDSKEPSGGVEESQLLGLATPLSATTTKGDKPKKSPFPSFNSGRKQSDPTKSTSPAQKQKTTPPPRPKMVGGTGTLSHLWLKTFNKTNGKNSKTSHDDNSIGGASEKEAVGDSAQEMASVSGAGFAPLPLTPNSGQQQLQKLGDMSEKSTLLHTSARGISTVPLPLGPDELKEIQERSTKESRKSMIVRAEGVSHACTQACKFAHAAKHACTYMQRFMIHTGDHNLMHTPETSYQPDQQMYSL